jgi:hypothetical protein
VSKFNGVLNERDQTCRRKEINGDIKEITKRYKRQKKEVMQ